MSQPTSSPDEAAGGVALSSALDPLIAQLVTLYAEAEQQMIAQMATQVRAGITAPTHSAAQLQALFRMRQIAQTIAVRLQMRSAPLAGHLAQQAAREGDTAAQVTLRRLVQARSIAETLRARVDTQPRILGAHGVAAANHIGLDLASKLTSVSMRITRFADDAYRVATADASTRQVLSLETPATAQARAWRQLANRGVPAFTDRTGRAWQMSAYVEMATRTSTQRAYNAAHNDRMTLVGIDLFLVPNDGHPCPLCFPWQGKVLSNEPDDRADATIAEATAAGLFHPQCRHILGPFIPGITKRAPAAQWTADDERRYQNTQRLRALEREVRAAKREQVGALTELDRKRAARHVRARQAAIRDHVQATGLVRRPRREQLDLGNR